MDESEEHTFGALLKRFRRRQNLTQLSLAYKLGQKTRSSIDNWERGLYMPKTPETVLAITNALFLSRQETNELLKAARYAPIYENSDSVTDDAPTDNSFRTRSHSEELENFLARVVPVYEVRIYQTQFNTSTANSFPYKFLDAFGIEDAQVFYGREAATKELYNKILHNRLTVLHAKSGAGKTSLLNAGISPRLIRGGRLPLYIKTYEDPVLALKRLIAPALLGPWPKLLKELPLYEFMGLVCASPIRQAREMIVMLDQFEQFFLLCPQLEKRRAFIKALGACYDDQSLPLRFVIALRGDYLTNLAEFDWVLPHLPVFRNQYSPKPMTLDEVQTAIIGPLTKLGISVTYDPALLDRLLTDLMRGEMELPLMQIICTRLYETRDKGEAQITLKSYEALGHAEGVLSHYLKSVLAHLPGNEEALAKSVLKELVRSNGMKQLLSYRALAVRVEAKREELDRVLAQLVDTRLLRLNETDSEIRYELAHEYLVAEIVKWMNPADQEFKQAEELLQREATNWRTHHMLIPKERLEVLYAYRKQFKGLNVEEWKFLLSSALAVDFAVADWVRAADDIGELFLVQSIENSDSKIRQGGVKALGEIGDPRAVEPLIAVLKDRASEVRQAAAWALEKIGTPTAVSAFNNA